MIAVMNTVQCAAGRRPEAREALEKWVEKCNKADPETKRYLLQPISGEINEIVLVSMFPSLAAFEEWEKKRQEDSEMQALMKEITNSEWYLGRQARYFDILE